MTHLRLIASLALALLASCTMAAPSRGDGPWTVAVPADHAFLATVLDGDQPVLSMAPMGFGLNWSWAPVPRDPGTAEGDTLNMKTLVTIPDLAAQAPQAAPKPPAAAATIAWSGRARKTGKREVSYEFTLRSERDVPLTLLTESFAAPPGVTGQVVATTPQGKEVTLPFPSTRLSELDAAKLVFQIKGHGDVTVTLDPPCHVQPENAALRVFLAHNLFKAGQSKVAMKFSFPGPASFTATAAQRDRFTQKVVGPDWFEFKGTGDEGPSIIGFENWLEKPAGGHGGVRIREHGFAFEDGTPVKFWGVGLQFAVNICPTAAQADQTAARFAKWGVNAVRLHKFSASAAHAWEGIGDPNDSTKLTKDGLERLDYFTSRLAANGMYYGFSHSFGFKVVPGDKARLVAYDEIIRLNPNGSTYSLINIAPDVQDLMIQMVVNLLKHANPHTGKTYAADPCLAWVELQNEDDVFWYTTREVLEKCPTYRRKLEERFADWLKTLYPTQQALARAWGPALGAGESLEKRNITVEGNPWTMGRGLPADGPIRVRRLDNAAFLHQVQDQFYSRFVKAIRAAGYAGPLCGSPWAAEPGLPNYYNLASDAQIGWVDRHNYFGGQLAATMLARPGSGNLGIGLQQVLDRPFGVSEWNHEYPALYAAEGPAIMAAYGMGLQGWSASFQFNSDSVSPWARDAGVAFTGTKLYVDVPVNIGQYPLLARMVARGDVKEGPVISVRRVSPQGLRQGRFDFADTAKFAGDVKEFGGTVPAEALAAGRVAVEFTDRTQASTFPDLAKFDKDKVITSATGQLRWDYSTPAPASHVTPSALGNPGAAPAPGVQGIPGIPGIPGVPGVPGVGHFTIDTEATKAVVGFAQDKTCTLGNVTIKLQCPYASVFLTAAGKAETLANAKTALLSALARNGNKGFTVFAPDGRIMDNGKAPIMLEPVKATITIAGRAIAAVNVLDHDGKRTDKTIPVTDGTFTIDGARDQAIYYEVVFK